MSRGFLQLWMTWDCPGLNCQIWSRYLKVLCVEIAAYTISMFSEACLLVGLLNCRTIVSQFELRYAWLVGYPLAEMREVLGWLIGNIYSAGNDPFSAWIHYISLLKKILGWDAALQETFIKDLLCQTLENGDTYFNNHFNSSRRMHCCLLNMYYILRVVCRFDMKLLWKAWKIFLTAVSLQTIL